MPTVLVTGFEPFGGEAINPSWEAVRQLDGRTLAGGAVVHARQLPCVFGASRNALQDAIATLRPQLVLCVGQAGGRAELSLERVAINVIDARIPDNAGQQPVDEPVVPGGPAAYFSTLPVKAMVAALRADGVPAAVSQTAGTYVCNEVFYALMHAAQSLPWPARAGFVHIPYLPQQAARHPGAPSMALEHIVSGLALMLETALATQQDLRQAGGTTH